MASSREIPIRVHPEFRRRAMSESFFAAGKPRVFTRSASLPGEPPQMHIVFETPDTDRHETETAKDARTSLKTPSQGTNRSAGTDGITQPTWLTYFDDDNFWKPNPPVSFRFPNVDNLLNKASRLSKPQGQRHYVSSGNPYFDKLDEVFENHFPSSSKFLDRKNGQCTNGSPDHGQAKDEGLVNVDVVSIEIPVQVEHEGNQEQTENGQKNVDEERRGIEDDMVIGQESRADLIPEVKKETEVSTQSLLEKDLSKVDKEMIGPCSDEMKADERQSGTMKREETEEQNGQNFQLEIEGKISENQDEELCTSSEVNKKNQDKVEKISRIKSIQEKAAELLRNVDAFNSESRTKEYLYLEELLTCCMLELDSIETDGDEDVRRERKATIKQLQEILVLLESKINAKSEGNDKPEKETEERPA